MKVTIDEAAERLNRGEIVAFPTETVYGLGARADLPDAIRKVFQAKGRPSDNPLIVHVGGIHHVERFAESIPDAAAKLIKAYWPGPLTIVLRRRGGEVPNLVTGGLDTVALRMPAHELALDLIGRTGPLVAPSANPSGRPSPTKASHIEEDYDGALPVVDGGATRIGLESTVVDCTTMPLRILRPGALDARSLEAASGVEVVVGASEGDAARSPGMKYRHYKPSAEVRWYPAGVAGMAGMAGMPGGGNPFLTDGLTGRPGGVLDGTLNGPYGVHDLLILHSRLEAPAGFGGHVVRFDGDFTSMASRLFDLFRWADDLGLSTIWIERLPETDRHPMIGALENRISKAAGD